MTKTYNPALIAKTLLKNEKLPSEFGFEHLDWYNQSASGLSAAAIGADKKETILMKSVSDPFDSDSQSIDQETIFNIASITKPITVATILRMMETVEFSKYFPDGLKTKLSEFYTILENRYPQLNYIKSKMRSEDSRILLQDLITHTSGIANFDGRAFGERLRFESKESMAKPIEADGRFLELPRQEGRYGEYSYSDVGYELLGMIISAIATDLSVKKGGKIIKCGQVMREMVIDKIGMRNTFTSDQMDFKDGRVVVKELPHQKIAHGYDCNYDGYLIESPVFRRCIATSAIYSTPLDICKFAKAVFSNETDDKGGLFKKEETIKLQNSFSVIQIEEKKEKKDSFGSDNYGIGFMFWVDSKGENKLQYHGARTVGYSGWVGYRKGTAACCLVSCQNLTTYFAKAKLELEVDQKKIENKDEIKHSRFYEINKDLLSRHRKEELISCLVKAQFDPAKSRQENNENLLKQLEILEKSKAPRPLSSMATAGKFGNKSRDGFNEI